MTEPDYAAELQELLHFLPLEHPRHITGRRRNECDSFQQPRFVGIARDDFGDVAEANDAARHRRFGEEADLGCTRWNSEQ